LAAQSHRRLRNISNPRTLPVCSLSLSLSLERTGASPTQLTHAQSPLRMNLLDSDNLATTPVCIACAPRRTVDAMRTAAVDLLALGAASVLLEGDRLTDEDGQTNGGPSAGIVDVYADRADDVGGVRIVELRRDHSETSAGCTLSAAVAAELAKQASCSVYALTSANSYAQRCRTAVSPTALRSETAQPFHQPLSYAALAMTSLRHTGLSRWIVLRQFMLHASI
jgi:hypothetical protein